MKTILNLDETRNIEIITKNPIHRVIKENLERILVFYYGTTKGEIDTISLLELRRFFEEVISDESLNNENLNKYSLVEFSIRVNQTYCYFWDEPLSANKLEKISIKNKTLLKLINIFKLKRS